MWACAWSRESHARIGRTMLEKSLKYKTREREGCGLTPEEQVRLEQLVKQYKRNSACFDGNGPLKPGTRLVRMHDGRKHNVLVKVDGFEYAGQSYSIFDLPSDKLKKLIQGFVWRDEHFSGIMLKDIAKREKCSEAYVGTAIFESFRFGQAP